jgi:hypothetical protein
MAIANDDDIMICREQLKSYLESKNEIITHFNIEKNIKAHDFLVKTNKDNGFVNQNCINNTCIFNRGIIMTEEERYTILKWVYDIIPFITKLPFKRAEYKLLKSNEKIPKIIFDIKNRIEEREELTYYDESESLKDFIGFVFPNGKIMKHVDKLFNCGLLYHVRFNVFILKPDLNFDTYYNNKIINSSTGTYALCRSGIDEHYSDINLFNLPRITLSFGYSLPIWKINKLLSKN